MLKVERFSFFTIFLLLVGCQPTTPFQHYSVNYPKTEKVTFNVELNDLDIEIFSTQDPEINITYDDLISDQKKIIIDYQEGIFTISSQDKISPRTMQIMLPPGCNITLEAFNTNITLRELSGNISVHTIAGDISASNLTGQVSLKSARGDVTLNNSHGVLSVLGEHGIITLYSNHGMLNAATIMGTIHFSGQIFTGDDIFLETDRGPVIATLMDVEDVFINVWTTNGTVTCMVDQIEMTSVTCKHSPSSPQGKFQVKTVWGTIQVKAQK